MTDLAYAELRWLIPAMASVLSVLIGNLFLDQWWERRRRERVYEKEAKRLRNLRWKVSEPADEDRLLGTAIEVDGAMHNGLAAAGWPVARGGKECDYCGYRWNPVLTTGSCPSCGYTVGRMLGGFVDEEYSLMHGWGDIPPGAEEVNAVTRTAGLMIGMARGMAGIWDKEGRRIEVTMEDYVLQARCMETGEGVPLLEALTGRRIE